MKNIFLLLLLLSIYPAISQTIRGTVYDENKETIAGASVYLDGTSLWTITDDKGRYELYAPNKINTSLVISFMGYAPKNIQNPFDNNALDTYLIPQMTALKEVTIVAEIFTRAEKLKVFREQFLGKTNAGKSCTILNEDDITFEYDLKTNTLNAYSEEPLRIRNEYLGYETEFSLMEFYINFRRKSIKSSDIHGWLLAGTTFFKDLTTPEKSYVVERNKSYEGSQMQFFRCLSKKSWSKETFMLYKMGKPCNADDYFIVEKDGENYNVTVNNAKLKKDADFLQSFTIEYDKRKTSYVIFKTREFSIDAFGNNDSFESILFSGEIGKNRAGDLLPMDFRLSN